MSLPGSTANAASPLSPSGRPRRFGSARWGAAPAKALFRAGISPGLLASALLAVSLAAGYLLAWGKTGPAMLLAAGCLGLRLFFALMRDLLAGRGAPRGRFAAAYADHWADRLADAAIFMGMGFGAADARGLMLGETALRADALVYLGLGGLVTILALLTARLRDTGIARGLSPDYSGLLPSPRRLTLSIAFLPFAAWQASAGRLEFALRVCLWHLAVGTAVTVWTRARRLWREERQ